MSHTIAYDNNTKMSKLDSNMNRSSPPMKKSRKIVDIWFSFFTLIFTYFILPIEILFQALVLIHIKSINLSNFMNSKKSTIFFKFWEISNFTESLLNFPYKDSLPIVLIWIFNFKFKIFDLKAISGYLSLKAKIFSYFFELIMKCLLVFCEIHLENRHQNKVNLW